MLTTAISPVMKTSFIFLQFLLIFHLLSAALTAATDPSDIDYEILPLIRVYKNGTVERLGGTEVVPPSDPDPETGVRSKDVIIEPKLNVSARLYLPQNASPSSKLPLLVYYHGGGFVVNSAFSPLYHPFLNSLAAQANAVAVSVDYRLAPENPLPIGYEDSYNALKWALSGGDEWIKNYVDFGLVYVGGDSAGANIAHNVARLAGLDGILLEGMLLDCPGFFGTKLIGNENCPCFRDKVDFMKSIWIHAYPTSLSLDDPVMNPAKDPYLSKLGVRRMLVYVTELDFFRDRGYYYVETLTKSEWPGNVKVREVMGEDHVFNLFKPDDPKSKEMLNKFAQFLNGDIVQPALPNLVASE